MPENDKTTSYSVTVILPTYNEAGNAIKLINAVKKATRAYKNWQVFFNVVDDNSPDHTADLTQKAFKNDSTVKIFIRTKERGLATAVLYGIKRAKTEYILFMDTDFNHDPKYIPEMIKRVEANPNRVISASRYISGGGMDKKEQYIGSRLLNDVIRMLLSSPSTDCTAGFMLIERKVLTSLPLDWIFRGYGEWGLRLHFLLNKHKYVIKEIPVYYPPRTYGESKTKIFSYSITLLKTIAEIRLYDSLTFEKKK